MQRTIGWRLGWLGVLLIAAPALADERTLPRFTEEREAAALHFVRKHSPELVPLLEELQKSSRPLYEQEIREVFHVTEILADLLDEPRRHEIELKIWKAETRAYLLVARLNTMRDDERKQLEAHLLELARELVELDLQSMELHAEQLDQELAAVKEETQRIRDNRDRTIRDRMDRLLESARKRKRPA